LARDLSGAARVVVVHADHVDARQRGGDTRMVAAQMAHAGDGEADLRHAVTGGNPACSLG
ncbi:MAG TPA: hypothetical protein VFW81_04770, partial [Thermoanaerobaculia bacterium]|nr:hypothetical protein [Thermoanaerobaculia bacterium]